MSDYDEPEEPTEDEVEEAHAENLAKSTPLKIEGITLAHVESAIRGIISGHYGLSERINRCIDKLIENRVAAVTDDVFRERIEAAIDSAIAQGVPEYDRYSGTITKRTSVAEMVAKSLTEETGDYYDKKGTRAQVAVRKAVNELFETELKGTLAEIKAEFKRQADAVFKAKLVAGMKEAIGLRD